MSNSPQKKQFERFYNTHIDKVYRFVFFRVGGNKEVAEDLVSEIFMKALEHFADYDPSLSKSAWIMTIAKNHVINYWRGRKPAESLPNENSEENFDAFWLGLAADLHKKDIIRREVYDLLEKIDDKSRQIVTFHYLFGYSYAEIAVMKEMNETAVKVAAHRAMKKLSDIAAKP